MANYKRELCRYGDVQMCLWGQDHSKGQDFLLIPIEMTLVGKAAEDFTGFEFLGNEEFLRACLVFKVSSLIRPRNSPLIPDNQNP